MILRGFDGDAFADGDFVYHLLLDWRSRSAALRAPWELTTGRSALSLCVAVVRTLEHGHAAPKLSLAVRTWGAGVPSAADARAALQCLGQAVSELVASGYGDFRPRGLDPVLEALAQEAVVPTGSRTVPLDIDELTRCPLRASLGRDLTGAVTAAATAGEDVTVAVLEVDGGRAARRGHTGHAVEVEDAQVLALLSTIRRTFGSRRVYRVGDEAFAVLAPGVGAVGMGELVLQATCVVGPTFDWGTASLRSVGPAAAESPDLLLPLAEADLHVRREDMARVRTVVTHHRRVSFAGAAAAALLLLAGIGVSVRGGPSEPTATTANEALPAMAAPHRAPPPSVTTPPAQSTATTNPAPPARATPPPVAPPTVPPSSNAVLTTSQTPLVPASAPPPPSPPPSTPPTTAPPSVPSPPTTKKIPPGHNLVDQILSALLHGLPHVSVGLGRHSLR